MKNYSCGITERKSLPDKIIMYISSVQGSIPVNNSNPGSVLNDPK